MGRCSCRPRASKSKETRRELDGVIHSITGHPHDPNDARHRRLQPPHQSFASPAATFLTLFTRYPLACDPTLAPPPSLLGRRGRPTLPCARLRRRNRLSGSKVIGKTRAAPSPTAPWEKKEAHASVLSGPAASSGGARGAPLRPPGHAQPWPGSWLNPRHRVARFGAGRQPGGGCREGWCRGGQAGVTRRGRL